MGDERSVDSEFREAPVAVADASPNGTADHSPSAAPDETADSPDFLTQLARAMQATAGVERSRASAEIDRRSTGHIAGIRARAESEATKMRDLAGDDRRAIERWAENEQQRIKAERDRRTKELETDLTQSLAEHGRQIDVQIQAVEAVVAKHRNDVDAFFSSLDGETDPIRFAQRAGQRPTFPDLNALSTPTSPETASGTAPGPAAAKSQPVGVMDPVARLGLLKHSPEPNPLAKPTSTGTTAATPAAAPAPAGSLAAPTLTASAPGASAAPGAPAASGSLPDGSAPPAARPSIVSPVAARTSGRPEEPKPETSGQAPHGGPMSWLRRGGDQEK